MMADFIATLDDLQFVDPTWRLNDNLPHNRSWFVGDGDAARFRLFARSSWPFDLRNYQSAYAFFERQSSENNGVMIDFAIQSIRGLEALICTFEYRAPIPQSLAMYYVGIIVLPFEHFTFQINFESLESGTTEMREALIAATEKKIPDARKEPIHVNSIEEMFDHIRRGKILRLPSDDAEHDASFPHHPLSKVRQLICGWIRTVVINPQLFSQKPYRI